MPSQRALVVAFGLCHQTGQSCSVSAGVHIVHEKPENGAVFLMRMVFSALPVELQAKRIQNTSVLVMLVPARC